MQQATEKLVGMSVSDKNELLFHNGINFNDLPTWQKRGSGVYWEEYEKPAQNPLTGEDVVATRRCLKRDLNLPLKDSYVEFIHDLIRRSA